MIYSWSSMSFGLGGVLLKPSPQQSCPIQWRPVILQICGKCMGGLRPASTLNMSAFICLKDNWVEETVGPGACYFVQTTFLIFAWTAQIRQPAWLHGIVLWACMSLCTWQSGLLLSWCAKNFTVPTMPSTCLATQTWMSQGRLWSGQCTDIQSTDSNWMFISNLRLLKKAFASCQCAPKQICSSVSDVIFSPCTNNPIGSNGNIPLDLALSIPSVAILYFAAWL